VSEGRPVSARARGAVAVASGNYRYHRTMAMNGVAPVPTAEMAVDERAALSAAACMCPAPPSRRLESQHPESPDLPGRFNQVLRRPLESTQFRSHAYVRMLRQAQLRGSMGRVGA
jgi:hypothetical protein